MPVIYTIGTSTRTLRDFIEILEGLNVKNAIDVRRYPKSKRFPHFSQESLRETLKNHGIRYFFLGDKLGGLRTYPYRDHVLTHDFEEGLSILESIARESLSVFFCCERLYFRCHRSYIARALKKRGWTVYHVLDLGKQVEERGENITSNEINRSVS